SSATFVGRPRAWTKYITVRSPVVAWRGGRDQADRRAGPAARSAAPARGGRPAGHPGYHGRVGGRARGPADRPGQPPARPALVDLDLRMRGGVLPVWAVARAEAHARPGPGRGGHGRKGSVGAAGQRLEHGLPDRDSGQFDEVVAELVD